MAKRRENAYIKEYKQSKTKSMSTTGERRKRIGKRLSFGASEAYKLLRTNLVFSMADEETCKVIGLTSALRGEGKSTTAANLAYSLAESGKKVLLIEADMRIPVMASILRLDETPGLSHVLAGLSDLNDAVRKTPLHSGLSIITAGEIPPNPSEMLSSKRMEQVIEALKPSFEYIIIDLPPVNAVSDSLAVARLLSGMIMVVRQNYCDQSSLAEAMRRMELMEVKLLGFVLNGAETPEKRYKKYGYRYGKYRYGKYGYDHSYSYGYGYGRRSSNSEMNTMNDTELTPPQFTGEEMNKYAKDR